MRIDQFENLINKYDPSINQIGNAIENRLSLFSAIYPEQRALLGVLRIDNA